MLVGTVSFRTVHDRLLPRQPLLLFYTWWFGLSSFQAGTVTVLHLVVWPLIFPGRHCYCSTLGGLVTHLSRQALLLFYTWWFGHSSFQASTVTVLHLVVWSLIFPGRHCYCSTLGGLATHLSRQALLLFYTWWFGHSSFQASTVTVLHLVVWSLIFPGKHCYCSTLGGLVTHLSRQALLLFYTWWFGHSSFQAGTVTVLHLVVWPLILLGLKWW